MSDCLDVSWSRTDKKINRLHGRALRIVSDDDVSTFDQLLAVENSFCIHHQSVQRLLIEIYKVLHDNLGNSLKELFVRREITINLRPNPELLIPSVNSQGQKLLKILYFRNLELITNWIREDHLILLFVT